MSDAALSELTDPGTLRVGINLGNILLVTGTSPAGDPEGVAPDMAAEKNWNPIQNPSTT